ncbi:hypothetical protein PN498_17515 [Oscillatoria sp. CS-180]|uniref:hypothetical protein n=1 Tax=Oscillatoria sp. CS-180 TaxID=3021720 RepID=UPI00232F4B97|nr:hypothetical protein [Oscillatoria sp. CS-180]MDB9527798.1 hypothetical protein [Oscillatoria sp. CS-180]
MMYSYRVISQGFWNRSVALLVTPLMGAKNGKSDYDLLWGVHYRKNSSNWQVSPVEFDTVIFQPPE